MLIGLPGETKIAEARVALTPAAVETLVHEGHGVLVQHDAGVRSGFPDSLYQRAGATVVATAAEAWAAELVVKVKEPQPGEFELFRPGLVLATYLHRAAEPELTQALLEREVDTFAYETVQTEEGKLPLLAPMSEIAGRMAAQVAAHFLEMPSGGAGKLFGGAPGVPPSKVLVVGVGVVGYEAAHVALGMGAEVTLADRNLDRLRDVEHLLEGRFVTLASNPATLRAAVEESDVVVGAVLIPGARAPRVISERMIASMRPGSVVVDVAIDQGGCMETSRPTSHSDPVFVRHGVVHYCVTNMPGAVPHTSTVALSNATLPYLVLIARDGLEAAAQRDPTLAAGLNTVRGRIAHPAVEEAYLATRDRVVARDADVARGVTVSETSPSANGRLGETVHTT